MTEEVVSEEPSEPAVDTATPAESASAAGDVPAELANAAVDVPVDVSAIASVPPLPMTYGDLASLGLAGWTPAGICRWGMEALHVSTGMPWFWTIVSATLLTRVILFPFTVRSMRSTAALAPHQPEINRLREKMQQAQATKDMLLLQQVALQQRSIYEKAGVSMGSMALLPLIQLPVTLGMFFGVKKLCDFPVEALKYSGVSWVPDLTVADPTGMLPIAAAMLINLQLTVCTRQCVACTCANHTYRSWVRAT